MPIDPNIALSFKAPQIENPMNVAASAMSMQNLSQQGQLQNMQLQQAQAGMQQTQAENQALKNNVTTNPDGSTRIDQTGAMNDLMKTNPLAAMHFQKTLNDYGLENMQKISATAKQLAFSATPDNWDQVKQNAVQQGLPNADKLPDQYIPSFVKSWQMHTLSGEEQVQAAQKQQEFDLKKQDITLQRQKMSADKNDKYIQHVEDNLKAWRSDPASLRFDTMLSAAASGKALIDKYRGDLDQMPLQDIHALVSDRLKAITGAAPTEPEIAAQMPHTGAVEFSKVGSFISGSPQPANAGDYVKNVDSSFRDMEGVARAGLIHRQETVASSPRISPQDRARLIKIGVPEKVYQDEPVMMKDPQGNIRQVPANMVDQAKAAGGVPL